jgi:hypothetical protein
VLDTAAPALRTRPSPPPSAEAVAAAIGRELGRRQNQIGLIASALLRPPQLARRLRGVMCR